jgi:hypothetical protein
MEMEMRWDGDGMERDESGMGWDGMRWDGDGTGWSSDDSMDAYEIELTSDGELSAAIASTKATNGSSSLAS